MCCLQTADPTRLPLSDLSGKMGDRTWATELVTAAEWAPAAHEREARVYGDLRFVAI